VAASGQMDVYVDRRIAKASQAFGALRRQFLETRTSVGTLKEACVLSVLLHGTELNAGYF